MSWSVDSNSSRRNKSLPVEYDLPLTEALPWRHKLTRLWRFLARR